MVTLIFLGITFFLWENRRLSGSVKKLFYLFIIVLYLLLRYQVDITTEDSDLGVYRYFYTHPLDHAYRNQVMFEPLYAYINTFFYNLGIKSFLVFFLIVQAACAYKSIQILSKNYRKSIVFVGYFVVAISGYMPGLLRQGIAITIFFLAIEHLSERKFIRYIFLILIGSLFHRSALVFLILPFLLEGKNKSKVFYPIIIALILNYFKIISFDLKQLVFNIVHLIGNKALEGKIVYYNMINRGAINRRISFGLLKILIILILLINIRKFIKREKGEKERKKLEISLIYIILYFLLIDFEKIGYRMLLYFLVPVYSFMLEYLPEKYNKLRNLRLVEYILLSWLIFERVIRIIVYKELF